MEHDIYEQCNVSLVSDDAFNDVDDFCIMCLDDFEYLILQFPHIIHPRLRYIIYHCFSQVSLLYCISFAKKGLIVNFIGVYSKAELLYIEKLNVNILARK